MKVKIYCGNNTVLADELTSRLRIDGIETVFSDKEMSVQQNLSGIDVIVLHPPYENRFGVWQSIKDFIEKHKEIQFYMLAINASERKEFFGNRKNLFYIDQTNQTEFFENPGRYIRK
ncbi:MAG TPA: hypothetical protein VJJ23_05555 [Candidatus Nanoarchaeia archaeon]|nr:hypothetical protein [Candidatus Nanoarchaeia archaeon]